MLSSVKKLFTPAPFSDEAYVAYEHIVAQARKPWFYQNQGVPDTVDGRFDLIVLHMFLTANRLQHDVSTDTSEFIRVLSEVFFADMDRSLREMGSTDTGTGKRVKAMASAFYGRLQRYEQSVSNEKALKQSLRRNLFRDTQAAKPEQLDALVKYVQRNRRHLQRQSLDDILSGQLEFID